MKISLDDKELMQFSELQKKIFLNEINSEVFHESITQRIKYAFKDYFDQLCKNLRNEWEPKLAARGHEMLPVKMEAFATLVFQQPDYRNKSQRDAESRQEMEARMALQTKLQEQESKLKSESTFQVL